MEIERKFLISKENLPADLDAYPHHKLEQGYLSTAPVVRIRKEDDNYYLTYKSKGLMTREEYNLPLTKESYEHMRPKADGILISKTRYLIPEKDRLTIELDVFDTPYEGCRSTFPSSPLFHTLDAVSGIFHRGFLSRFSSDFICHDAGLLFRS